MGLLYFILSSTLFSTNVLSMSQLKFIFLHFLILKRGHVLVTFVPPAMWAHNWYWLRSFLFLIIVHQFICKLKSLCQISSKYKLFITFFPERGPSFSSTQHRMKSSHLMKSARRRLLLLFVGVVPFVFYFLLVPKLFSHGVLPVVLIYAVTSIWCPSNQNAFQVSLSRSY